MSADMSQEGHLIIYHDQCTDGFTSYWIAARSLAKQGRKYIQGHAAKYGSEPPDTVGMHVYILDFCYPTEVIEEMARDCISLTLLDHHKTAESSMREAQQRLAFQGNVHILFDMNQSGAGLTARHFDNADNWIAKYVEDRDLWRFALPDSREINAYLGSLEFDFDQFEAVYKTTTPDQAKVLGMGSLSYQAKYVRETARTARHIDLKGRRVIAVNAPRIGISELLHELLKMTGYTTALGWSQDENGKYLFSLRSEAPVDVSELAQAFGGGGHAQAAGFTLASRPDWL